MAGRFIDEIRAELDYSACGSALPRRIFSAAAHFDAAMMAGDEERDDDVSE